MSNDRLVATAWCGRCGTDVLLKEVRPWPKGELVTGVCPGCEGTIAARGHRVDESETDRRE